jgi:hypothetical protein
MGMSKEKITLNSIPVYRTVEDDGSIKYVLFEDNENYSSVLYIAEGSTRKEEYSIVLGQIMALIAPKDPDVKEFGVNVVIQEYEQSKRNKQWLQKPSLKQARPFVYKG